jgi:hypothetical protein
MIVEALIGDRAKHGPQEYVPEGMFDDSINLVVWGHEHDCRIEPEEVPGKPYFITRPGLSVATSLSDGESIPKSVNFLVLLVWNLMSRLEKSRCWRFKDGSSK